MTDAALIIIGFIFGFAAATLAVDRLVIVAVAFATALGISLALREQER